MNCCCGYETESAVEPHKMVVDENDLYYKLKTEKTNIVKEKLRHSIHLDELDLDLIRYDFTLEECRRIIELFNAALKKKEEESFIISIKDIKD